MKTTKAAAATKLAMPTANAKRKRERFASRLSLSSPLDALTFY